MIVGVDPGKQGALSAITPTGHLGWLLLPYVGKRDIDERAVQRWLVDLLLPVELVVIENVTAFKMGRTSAFTFGHGCGQLSMMFRMMRYRIEYVAPSAWQKAVLGKSAGKDKSVAKRHVRLRWPGLELPTAKAKAEAVADATSIAEYGLKE